MKVLRKIRERMLNQNQTKKYLFYAIGEIFLVVVGILIALQINNWNEQRILVKTERDILKVMQRNLKSDLIDMATNVEFYTIRLKANEAVLESFKNPQSIPDTLKYSYANLGTNPYFLESTSAYENLKSVGFEIIKNDSLREAIIDLYEIKYEWIDNLEKDHSTFYSTKLEPLLLANFKSIIPFVEVEAINPEELATNNNFIETLKYNKAWIGFMLDRYEEISQASKNLMNDIDADLKRNQ